MAGTTGCGAVCWPVRTAGTTAGHRTRCRRPAPARRPSPSHLRRSAPRSSLRRYITLCHETGRNPEPARRVRECATCAALACSAIADAALGTGLRRYDGLGRRALAGAHGRHDGRARHAVPDAAHPQGGRARSTSAEAHHLHHCGDTSPRATTRGAIQSPPLSTQSPDASSGTSSLAALRFPKPARPCLNRTLLDHTATS